MKHAVLFTTLTFLATFVLVGWTNGGLSLQEPPQVLGARSSFWHRILQKIRRPAAIPTSTVRAPTPSVTQEGGSGAVSDDPEEDLVNLEQELRSIDQEMSALTREAQAQ